MFGIGRRDETRLQRSGVRLAVDLGRCPQAGMKDAIGVPGLGLHAAVVAVSGKGL